MTRPALNAMIALAMIGFFYALFGGDLLWTLLFGIGGAVFLTARRAEADETGEV